MLKKFSSIGKPLSKTEQKEIAGGRKSGLIGEHQAFVCYCGFHNSEGIDQTPFIVYADDVVAALNSAGPSCGGQGITCSGL
ncbi:hypothetical protein [Aquimarina sp. 2201CG5-10]|uniref:hypothetical protein n=1 Tax=Aquimarina callyspongiae TaxID=3098150 RepID=UPI002AB3CE2C|nr:hypothetical protein [Aquimarina sp. 2201CG5-10]MDY8135725.1 hypothetical protein [Aquimarina sp. 2201CG5-10]